MATNLKRKRTSEPKPRKAAKLNEELDPSSVSEHESGDEVMNSDEGSDDEEWGGIETEEAAGNVGEVAPSVSDSSKAVKPPTGGELRVIREATDLYRSSTFKLQVRRLSFREDLI